MAFKSLHAVVLLALLSHCAVASAQQNIRGVQASEVDEESLFQVQRRAAQPQRRLKVSNIGSLAVRNGDNSTERVREIAIKSFKDQATFAQRMNKAELVNKLAIAELPEVDDEVLVYKNAVVVRRSTTIIVIEPQQVAQESPLFRSYLGEQSARAQLGTRLAAQPAALEPEERAGLRQFMQAGVRTLHPKDPLRDAAARGEDALLEAIIAGKGALTIEDTLIIPTESGTAQGGRIAIPTIRNGIFDLANPEPVKELSIRSLGDAGPDPKPATALLAKPAQPKKPARQAMQPKHEATGKQTIKAEFLLGMSRAANFQWERKWTFPSGYFRLTLGAGYAIGYRVPVLATARVEPIRAYIRDYADKTVVIGASANATTSDANGNFYKRAGLGNNLVKNGRELLYEANVGYGYKFRALWRTIASRPYTAIGISYSQNFTPPNDASQLMNKQGGGKFVTTLDPKTTKISVDRKFIGGSASIRFDGRAWGALSLKLQSLVDNKVQKTFAVKSNVMTAAGAYPFKLRLNPLPLQQGQTSQVRAYGVRLTNPEYEARLVVRPALKLGFRVGYKKLSRNFSTDWIPLNSMYIDTGKFRIKAHSGTRSRFDWNKGEKIYVKINKPDSGPAIRSKQSSTTAIRQIEN